MSIVCPHCHKTIETVRVFSRCEQIGALREDMIVEYTELVIENTIEIACSECGGDIRVLVHE